jgi:hypothetical protein
LVRAGGEHKAKFLFLFLQTTRKKGTTPDHARPSLGAVVAPTKDSVRCADDGYNPFVIVFACSLVDL